MGQKTEVVQDATPQVLDVNLIKRLGKVVQRVSPPYGILWLAPVLFGKLTTKARPSSSLSAVHSFMASETTLPAHSVRSAMAIRLHGPPLQRSERPSRSAGPSSTRRRSHSPCVRMQRTTNSSRCSNRTWSGSKTASPR